MLHSLALSPVFNEEAKVTSGLVLDFHVAEAPGSFATRNSIGAKEIETRPKRYNGLQNDKPSHRRLDSLH